MSERVRTVGRYAVRGAALFLGGFTLIGLIGEVRGRTTDASLWLVDLQDVPDPVRFGLLAAFCGLLIAWSVRQAPGHAIRPATALACVVFAVLALRDTITFVSATQSGLVHATMPVPLSLVFAVSLGAMAVAVVRMKAAQGGRTARTAIGVSASTACWAVVFALAQMAFFGTTDYRRPADAAVVFGARVYSTGLPSPLLADRIQTGVELYRAGLAPILIMSGGDGSDGYNEAQVMRDQAVAAGVDPAAIIADPAGVSTEATVANTMTILTGPAGSQRAAGMRLLAVSQAYHLPRVQLAFAAAGIDVLTVPTVDAQPIGEMPLLIAREVPGFWVYYLRACLF